MDRSAARLTVRIGGIVGTVLFLAGLVLHLRYGPIASEWNHIVSQFGQGLLRTYQHDGPVDRAAANVSIVFLIAGGVAAIWAICTGVALTRRGFKSSVSGTTPGDPWTS